MNEVEKMYKLAGVKKYRLLDRGNKLKWVYPPFTPERRLEICKFLLKAEHSISYYFYENRYGFVIDDKQDNCIEAEKFETALAMIVNYLWQDLTEEERKQIAEILR